MGTTQIEEIILKVSVKNSESISQVGKLSGSLDKSENSANNLNKKLLALSATILGLVGGIRSIGKASDTALNFQKVENSLLTVFGSSERVREEWQFMSRVADTLGLDVLKLSKDYSQVAAAAKGTSLEGKGARDILVGTAAATAALSLSADDASGALRAMNQIVSKGKVQAEELRGQLGERIPGAFQIAARAMNTTTGELSKMLETGKILSEDFMPKFAAQLKREFAAGAMAAANKEVAMLNRISNDLNETWRRFGVVANSFIPMIANDLIPSVTNAMESLLDTSLDYAEEVLPNMLSIAGGVIEGLATMFSALYETVQAVFGLIGDGWSGLAGEIVGEYNWIESITDALTIAAQVWPQLLVKPFLMAFKLITDGLSFVTSKITEAQDKITRVALAALHAAGQLTDYEYNETIKDMDQEGIQKSESTNFFDGLSANLQAELDEINETIDDASDNVVGRREEREKEVHDFVGDLRKKIANVFSSEQTIRTSRDKRATQQSTSENKLKLSGTTFEAGTSAATEFLKTNELEVERNDLLKKVVKGVQDGNKNRIITKG